MTAPTVSIVADSCRRAEEWADGLGISTAARDQVVDVVQHLARSAPYAVRDALDQATWTARRPAGGLSVTAAHWLASHGITVDWWVQHWSSDGTWHGDACGCPDRLCVGVHHSAAQACGCMARLLALVHANALTVGTQVVISARHDLHGHSGTVVAVQIGSSAPYLVRTTTGQEVRCQEEDLMPDPWPPAQD